MRIRRYSNLVAAAGLALHASVLGQNLLPNPSFEEGSDRLIGWTLSGGIGQVARAGGTAADGRCWIAVEGNGEDANSWRTAEMAFRPGGLYRFEFAGRLEPGTRDGTAVAGPSRVNRDFRLGDSWQRQSFVFQFPEDSPRDYVRVGQWQVRGRVAFDRVSLVPVMATHTRHGQRGELGEGESIRNGVYRFTPDLNWRGANYHRPLVTNRAGFNSNRWLFSPGAEIVYRLGVAGSLQKTAALRVAINHHSAGTLRVEASRDGRDWSAVAEFDGEKRGGRAELPAALLPAEQILVRLSQAGEGAGFQVDTIEYEATLQDPPSDAEGRSLFVESIESSPNVAPGLGEWEPQAANGGQHLALIVTNLSSRTLTLTGQAVVAGAVSDSGAGARAGKAVVSPGESGCLDLRLELPAAGEHAVAITVTDASSGVLFQGMATLRVGLLDDASYGYWLAERAGLTAWWCESGWKVGRDRAAPSRTEDRAQRRLRLAAARNEYEAVQLVLRPDREATLLEAPRFVLRDDQGRPSPIVVRVDEVAYVQVVHPTDISCARGWYPDPLPPLETPLTLAAGRNQPLWITAYVPRGARAGRHRGRIELETTVGPLRIPFQVEVFDFVLPAETHLHSALGLGTSEINRYHRLNRPEDRVAVFEQYLENFAAHRISPYTFYDYASIQVRFEGEGTNRRANVDFTAFDQAAKRWLDERHFSTFQLHLRGMGGGTFHSRHLGQLEGFSEGTPEHSALFKDYLGQVEAHLRAHGWLSQAFTYWFDEPDPKDYAFVVAGQQRIKEAAPGLRRMLTEQPEPELSGHVDIWCGLTPEWTPETVRARKAAGEEVWWYICTAPKAPYVTEFIDHPGTELRLWPWQSWQYGVSGILVWATTYWSSPLVYPEPAVQDPWQDPMSWVTGYGNPVGHRSPWGNGDGRFLYPPRRDPASAAEPNLDPPINSLRWENLRDGMEDYEYLWLLEQALKRVSDPQGRSPLAEAARDLLVIPPEISKDLTHFATDPRPILAHRAKVARMIERLNGASD